MSCYTQLTREQRYQIQALMKTGQNQTQMATVLGVHKTTISRELRRNRGLRGYRPHQAHQCAQARQTVNQSEPCHFELPQVRKERAKTLWIKASKWLNFLDPDDVLGWPLKPLYEKNLDKLTPQQKKTVARIEDDDINVGSLATSWNPAAHLAYWTDNDFTKPVSKYLRQVVQALDA